MDDAKTLDRRTFTLEAALAILGGVTITISACGGSSYNPGTPSTPAPNPTPNPTPTPAGDKAGSVSVNHGHTAVITAAELTAGGALSLDIRGEADHTHSVSLSAAEIMAIAANQRVSVSSSSEQAHNHTVTFN